MKKEIFGSNNIQYMDFIGTVPVTRVGNLLFSFFSESLFFESERVNRSFVLLKDLIALLLF